MNTRRKTPLAEVDQYLLGEVKRLTEEIRVSQNDIVDVAEMRRTKILDLRQHRITYREIAEAMGVSEQIVYKILAPSIAESRPPEAEGSDA